MTKVKQNQKNITFEEAFSRLVEISNQLESSEKSLEDSVKLYEESVKLRKFCEDFIKKTKLKITKIEK